MARSRTVIVAGGGIGGLTAALTLAAKGFRVVVVEQADRLEETGAGIQLSPNATRVLSALGLAERLAAVAVAPSALAVRTYRGRQIVRVPLGSFAQ
ncbi:MAG: FAD-dependent monooxygenase, partial [Xanthobacteraceae bacterium]